MRYYLPTWFYVCYIDSQQHSFVKSIVKKEDKEVNSNDEIDYQFVPVVNLSKLARQLKKNSSSGSVVVPFDSSVVKKEEPKKEENASDFSAGFFPTEFSPRQHSGVPEHAKKKSSGIKKKTVNPFSLSIQFHATTSSRRWASLYQKKPVQEEASIQANPNYVGLLSGVNWKSLTEPASLPVSTDFFPSISNLKTKNFQQYNYTLSLIPGENNYQDNPRLLFKELVAQRLAHGKYCCFIFFYLSRITRFQLGR